VSGRARRASALLALAAMLATACSGGGAGSPTGGSAARPDGREAAKPPLVGFVDRTGLPSGANADLVTGAVIPVDWADLQPDGSGSLAHPNPIDRALETVASSRELAGVRLKIRVDAGLGAPAWLLDEAGSVPVAARDGSERGRLPRSWTDAYGAAYEKLQALLADSYDGQARVAEVVMSGCMTLFAEPLLRGNLTSQSLRDLTSAGLNVERDQACLRRAVHAHEAWKRTASSLALNPFQRVAADGSIGRDIAFALELARVCRDALGSRCLLQNNSIRWPPIDEYADLYAGMERLGPPIAFQTAAPARIGDWSRTLRWAAAHGARSVEVSRDYGTYDPARLAQIAQELSDNA
jgi:hypothetical protein